MRCSSAPPATSGPVQKERRLARSETDTEGNETEAEVEEHGGKLEGGRVASELAGAGGNNDTWKVVNSEVRGQNKGVLVEDEGSEHHTVEMRALEVRKWT